MIVTVFTRDFRLLDNELLRYDNTVPVMILDDFNQKEHGVNLRSLFFKYVYEFDRNLRSRGKRLHIVRWEDFERFVDVVGPSRIVYSLDPEPRNRTRYEKVRELGERRGIRVDAVWQFPTKPLPWSFSTFTQFYRNAFTRDVQEVRYDVDRSIDSMIAFDLDFLIDTETLLDGTDGKVIDRYYKTEAKIRQDLTRFLESVDYQRLRDYPGIEGTSRLSPYLRVGAISYRTVLSIAKGNERFVSEIAWSDFYRILLWNFPEIVDREFNPRWREVRWRTDQKLFDAWKEGETGYDIVDAGMRQLKREGWMHNRVRMITASFLTKNLRIDWRLGERYFYSMLVDADLAQNVGNWQWVAGSGTDSVYFRVFNPEIQREKFDPDRSYVLRYLDRTNRPKIVDLDRSRREYLEWIKAQTKI